jgi:hypothetical protein
VNRLAAITLTLGVTTYGLLTGRLGVALLALAAGVAIVLPLLFRARASLRAAELSSKLLDSALTESERKRAELDRANASLQQANASLRMMHLAVREGFSLIDERTQGRLRELVEQTGDDLAAVVDERLGD